MLLSLWAGLVYYVELGKGFFNATLKFVGLLQMFWVSETSPFGKSTMELLSFASYVLLSILIGGLIGALIMGIYWTVTSLLLNMHCGDAFGALMIKDYNHFLRMRFDNDTLTIYPIAVEKVPSQRGWRAPTTEERFASQSQIVPKSQFAPHLIEPPIVIKASDVRI